MDGQFGNTASQPQQRGWRQSPWQALAFKFNWPQPKPRPPVEYPIEVRQFSLPKEGCIEYAQWLHPKEKEKEIRQENVDALREFISPGDFVIDVGAHSGDTTLPMALAAGPTGLTLALEPNPLVYRVLSVNASLNPLRTRIEPRCFAATDSDGEYQFDYSDDGFCNGGDLSDLQRAKRRHPFSMRVTGKNLARFLRSEYLLCLPRLSLIKVDTEGHDLQVLKSLNAVLEQFRPTIICEVYRFLPPDQREGLYGFLKRHRYQLFFWNSSGGKGRTRPLGLKTFLSERHFDLLAIPAK